MDMSKAAAFLRDTADLLADEPAACVEIENDGDPGTAVYLLFGELTKGDEEVPELHVGEIGLDRQKQMIQNLLKAVENAEKNSDSVIAVDLCDNTCAVLFTGHADENGTVRFDGVETSGEPFPLCFGQEPDTVKYLTINGDKQI